MILKAGAIVTWLFRIFLLSTFVIGKVRNGTPSFIENGNNVRAPLGRDAVFNCTVRDLINKKVSWRDHTRGTVLTNHDDKITDNPRISIQHSTSSSGIESFILTLEEVTHKDEGIFMCQINTYEVRRRFYNLSIVVPPYIKDDSSGDVEVSEGESAVLVCLAGGTPTPVITWRREDSKYMTVNEKNQSAVDGQNLKLTGISRTEAGAYLCIAKNGVRPSVSKRILLDVRFGPEIFSPYSTLSAYLGENIRMTCVVNGWPRPTMYWKKESNRNEEGVSIAGKRDKYKLAVKKANETTYEMILTIYKLTKDDILGYQCVANNSNHMVEDKILLIELQTTTTTTSSTSTTSTTLHSASVLAFTTTLSTVYIKWQRKNERRKSSLNEKDEEAMASVLQEGKNGSVDFSSDFPSANGSSSRKKQKGRQSSTNLEGPPRGNDPIGGHSSHSYISNGAKNDWTCLLLPFFLILY